MLSEEHERALACRWRASEELEARDELIHANLGLVVHMAGSFRREGLPLDDLIQEGNIGLIIAVQRFDPALGNRLSTYASYWIRAFMTQHVIRSHGPVRIGGTRAQRRIFFGYRRACRLLDHRGDGADPDVLARVLGVSRAEFDEMLPRLSAGDRSIDSWAPDTTKRSVGATLSDGRPSAEELLSAVQEGTYRRGALRTALTSLDDRERAVVLARHLVPTPAPLRALGAQFNISCERVRQLELRALKKLTARCRGVQRTSSRPGNRIGSNSESAANS